MQWSRGYRNDRLREHKRAPVQKEWQSPGRHSDSWQETVFPLNRFLTHALTPWDSRSHDSVHADGQEEIDAETGTRHARDDAE